MTINNATFSGNNQTFDWTEDGVAFAAVNSPYQYAPSCLDSEGDSLVFQLVDIKGANGTPCTWVSGFSATTPIPSATATAFDNATGVFSATPNAVGIYYIGYLVTEFRGGNAISQYNREIILHVMNSSNQPPIVDSDTVLVGGRLSNDTLYACGVGSFTFQMEVTDTDIVDSVAIYITSTNLETVFGIGNYTINTISG